MRVSPIFLALAVALAVLPGAAVAGGPADPADGSASTHHGSSGEGAPDSYHTGSKPGGRIDVTYAVAKTPTEGVVEVTATYDLPDGVTRLELDPAAAHTIDATDGFVDQSGAHPYRWDQVTETPSVTYRVDLSAVDQDSRRSGDGGEWALVEENAANIHFFYWWQGADVGYREDVVRQRGERGVAAAGVVYLGPYDATRSEHYRLVVPEAARLDADRQRVLASLERARSQLSFGGTSDRVTVFVAPEPLADGGYVPHLGEPAMIVHASELVPNVDNTWMHEYVHTRQRYTTTSRMAWVDEGSAEYYAALATAQQGRAGYDAFRAHVTSDRYRSVDLTAPDTWPDGGVEYVKGSRVIAAIDARIHRATDGRRSFQDVFKRMNAHDGRLSADDFVRIVSDIAGRDLDSFVRGAMTGQAPTVPNDTALFVPAGAGDTDGDGLADDRELSVGTSLFRTDTDDDGLEDRPEVERGTEPTAADTDGDQLSDPRELDGPTDPTAYDTDQDGLADATEIRGHTDPTVGDTDGDGLSDQEEVDLPVDPTVPDTDGDGLDDGREYRLDTKPLAADTDGDGLDDAAEAQGPSDPTVADTDGEGLNDSVEKRIETDPTSADTDGDGLDDSTERPLASDPTNADTDGDGLDDGQERQVGSDPTAVDTDGEGLDDDREVELDADPTVTDTDGEGLNDSREAEVGADPTVPDTDGDGWTDAKEISYGTNPTAHTGFFAKIWAEIAHLF